MFHGFIIQPYFISLLFSLTLFSFSFLILKVKHITSSNFNVFFKIKLLNLSFFWMISKFIIFISSDSKTKFISMHNIKLFLDDLSLKLILFFLNLLVLFLSLVSSFMDNLFFLCSSFLFFTSNVESFFFQMNFRFLVHVNIAIPQHKFGNWLNRIWHSTQHTFWRLLLSLSLICSKIEFSLLINLLSS